VYLKMQGAIKAKPAGWDNGNPLEQGGECLQNAGPQVKGAKSGKMGSFVAGASMTCSQFRGNGEQVIH
jgi:hypothetical protein